MAKQKGARGAPQDDASIAGARHTTSGGDSTVGASGASTENSRGVVTMVCITCGAEQFFSDKMPTNLKCPRCSGTVFRQFDTPTDADEATISGLEEQARSIQWGDSSPQTTASDVRDLDDR
jgi:DNA-directed RNA polymerase subunit RPC12/RpoP